MSHERDEYMRAQEAQIDLISQRTGKPNVMRQTYRPLSTEDRGQIAALKLFGEKLLDCIEEAKGNYAKGGREFALAKTKVEEAVMWATKGVTA